MCFGGGGLNKQSQIGNTGPNGQNIIPIPVNPGQYSPKGMTLTPYQNGVGTGMIGAGNLNQGMNMAGQSFDQLGRMGNMFMQNANHAGDPNYNPGIGAFQSATNQNTQNTAAALASQRGSSADPGLAARNIGEMGARTQQGAVGQLGQVVAGYKGQQQGNALNAFGQQGQEAGVYGQIAGAYANMGLQNQAQILGAIAAQNMAQVTMQSNINSTNAQMFGQQLGYTANIFGTQGSMYNAQLGYQSNANQQNNSMWGGILGGIGGVLSFLNQGGIVGRDGYQRYAKGGSVNRVPKYANGGRIPETKRRKMADGGAADPFAVTSVQDGPFKGMKYGDQNDNLGGTGAFSGGSDQAMKANSPQSMVGKMMKGMQIPSSAMAIQQGNGGYGAPNPVTGMARGGPVRRYDGGGMVDPRRGNTQGMMMAQGQQQGFMPPQMGQQIQAMRGQPAGMNDQIPPDIQRFRQQQQGGILGPSVQDRNPGFVGWQPQMNRGGQVPGRPGYAMGGSIDPRQQQQMRGPMIPNTGLAGSTNPGIAAPPTGLPMGGVQTRGGGPLPAPGMSGAYQPQMDQQSRPMYARGGYAQGGYAAGGDMPAPTPYPRGLPGYPEPGDYGKQMLPSGERHSPQMMPNSDLMPNAGFNVGGANPDMRQGQHSPLLARFRHQPQGA